MSLFESIILDVIYITFPLTLYLLYHTYNQTLNKEKNELTLDFALFSGFYLIIRMQISIPITILLLNIPLILAYVNNRKVSSILFSVLLIFYYAHIGIPILLSMIEYIGYFLIYMFYSSKKNFVNLLLEIKCICFMIAELCFYQKYDLYNILISLFVFFIITKFIIYLFEQAEKTLSLHLKLKEFEKEKNIRESLFKITHEIKNPIAVCKGYLDMFDVNNPEHSKKYVPILKNEISHILILLEDFLSINKIKIEKDIMDLNLLIENIYSNFTPILQDKGIEVNFNLQDNELFMVGDYNRISQVLINIIKNSIESIPQNRKGKIAIYVEEQNTNLKIIVEDNGSGMNPEELEKIKEPFFTTKQRGTGLGIFLSNEIIKGHNGSMKYTSQVGEGTKVILTFPRNKSDFANF